jgi:zinc transporter ZupT
LWFLLEFVNYKLNQGLHNFPEGMAVYLGAMKGFKLGLTIAIGKSQI